MAIISATRCTGNRLFFMDGLKCFSGAHRDEESVDLVHRQYQRRLLLALLEGLEGIGNGPFVNRVWKVFLYTFFHILEYNNAHHCN